MSKLTEKAVALLQEGEVNLVIGYEEGNHEHVLSFAGRQKMPTD